MLQTNQSDVKGDDPVVYTPVVNFHDYTYTGPDRPVEEQLEAAQERIRELEKLVENQSFFLQLHGILDRNVRFHTGFPFKL